MSREHRECKHLKVGPAWSGFTVLAAVRHAFPEVTPREVFRQARTGDLLVNGARCRPTSRVREGDVVAVLVPRPPRPQKPRVVRRHEPVETSRGSFFVVREDEELLAVSKPSGCASHPAHRHRGDTLIERIRAHLDAPPDRDFQPALANRLDIETSGLVLIGKTRNAQRKLGRHLQRGNVDKFYLALVGGWPQPAEAEIRVPLVRRPDSRDRARLNPGHRRLQERLQEAVTRYRTIQSFQHPLQTTLLEIELVTGRTHQIRRHLAHVGHPVGGDRRYGDPGLNRELAGACGLTRLALHAGRVCLPHPSDGKPIELVAPVPEDLGAALRALGWTNPEEPEHHPPSSPLLSPATDQEEPP